MAWPPITLLTEVPASPRTNANADGPRLGKMKGLPVAHAANAGMSNRDERCAHRTKTWRRPFMFVRNMACVLPPADADRQVPAPYALTFICTPPASNELGSPSRRT